MQAKINLRPDSTTSLWRDAVENTWRVDDEFKVGNDTLDLTTCGATADAMVMIAGAIGALDACLGEAVA